MKERTVTRNQLLALSTVTLLAPALRLYPSSTAELAGGGAWFCAVPAFFLLLPYLWVMLRFYRCAGEGEGLPELLLRAYGRIGGPAVLALTVAWLLLYCGFVLRSGADRFQSTVYPRTEAPFFVLSMGLVGTVAALCSLPGLCRVAKLVLPVVLGVLVLCLLSALPFLDGRMLTPVSRQEIHATLIGTLPTLDILGWAVACAGFALPVLRRQGGDLPATAGWMGGVCALLSALGAVVVGFFGPTPAAKMSWPFFSLVRSLSFWGTVERAEALVVALWVFADFLTLGFLLLAAGRCVGLLLGSKKRRPLLLFCAGAAMAVGFFLAPDSGSLSRWSLLIIPGINLGFSFLLFPAAYVIGKLRRTL